MHLIQKHAQTNTLFFKCGEGCRVMLSFLVHPVVNCVLLLLGCAVELLRFFFGGRPALLLLRRLLGLLRVFAVLVALDARF